MFAATYFFLSIIGLGYATYTDLKERIVPNKLTFALIGTGIVLKLFESFSLNSYEPIMYSLIAGAIGFAFGYLLWRLGVWAGGDVKLVTAIAILNPFNTAMLSQFLPIQHSLLNAITFPVFPITLTIYSALMVFPLGIAMSLGAALKHKEVLKTAWKNTMEKAISLISLGILVTGITTLLENFLIDRVLLFPILIVFAIFPKKARLPVIVLAGIYSAYFGLIEFVQSTLTISLPLIIAYGFWNLYSASKKYAFSENVKINELNEGMIVDSYIIKRGKSLTIEEGPSIKKVIKQLIDNKLEKALQDVKIEGEIIASPKHAGGLEQETVDMLKQEAKKGNFPKEIRVKKSMAFVPAIFLAYIVLQISGDIIWNLIL